MSDFRGVRRARLAGIGALAAGLAALAVLAPSCKVEEVKPKQCAGDGECSDGDKCTEDQCVNGTCSHTLSDDPACSCVEASDCDDNDPCTSNDCVLDRCEFTPIENCGGGGAGGGGGMGGAGGGGGMGGAGGGGACNSDDICDAEEDCACQDCAGLPACSPCAKVEVINLAQQAPPNLYVGSISPALGGAAPDELRIHAGSDATGTFGLMYPPSNEWCGTVSTCFLLFEDVAGGTPGKVFTAGAGIADCGTSTADQLACTITDGYFVESELQDIGGGMVTYVPKPNGACIEVATFSFDFQM